MPSAPVTALAGSIAELPVPCARVTVFPATGLPFASFNVTVTVEVAVPSAKISAGRAVTVDSCAEASLATVTVAMMLSIAVLPEVPLSDTCARVTVRIPSVTDALPSLLYEMLSIRDAIAALSSAMSVRVTVAVTPRTDTL
ncbi:hypothetical protein SDC9_94137 [bioreactor metagenome]|uniref:Uncharacterized protein n=1 Tax=bioreactor metagenome TaxID=1076179 RepID=A0A645A2X3_9ZZZZ